MGPDFVWVLEGDTWKKQPKPTVPVLVPLDSKDGQARLQRANVNHFERINRYFCKQLHRTYCGVCSAAIALNALLQPSDSLKLTEGTSSFVAI